MGLGSEGSIGLGVGGYDTLASVVPETREPQIPNPKQRSRIKHPRSRNKNLLPQSHATFANGVRSLLRLGTQLLHDYTMPC